jgi:hypothetical protein
MSGSQQYSPRIRATEGGMPINYYLAKAEVSGGFFLIYLTTKEIGEMSRGGLISEFSGWDHRDIILEDLDARKSWQPVRWSWHPNEPYWVLSFENVTGRRFSLSDAWRKPDKVFSEFIFGR